MAGKQDYFLTKAAKKLADQIKSASSGLTLRQIVSAGVVAFSELDADRKLEYLTKAQMGDLLFEKPSKTLDNAEPEQVRDDLNKMLSKKSKRPHVHFELLSPEEQQLLDRLRDAAVDDLQKARDLLAASFARADRQAQKRQGGTAGKTS